MYEVCTIVVSFLVELKNPQFPICCIKFLVESETRRINGSDI